MQSNVAWAHRSTRVLRMVSELHRMGYQRARIMPHIHPLGYRIVVAPADRFSLANPAFSETAYDEPAVAYSSASGNRYFEWPDAASDNARQVADKIAERFPVLAGECAGSDWCYAGWFCALLGTLERDPDDLPFVMEEYMEETPDELRHVPMKSVVTGRPGNAFPLPPPFVFGSNS